MKTANNDALVALFKVWAWNADWMTCRLCERNLIASREGEALRHEHGCLNVDQQHPWTDLRVAMGTEEEATGLFTRLISRRDRIEVEELAQARAIVVAHNKGSISLVQRLMGIRYSHASLLCMRLEKTGVLSPVMGNGGRRVLAKPENASPSTPKDTHTPPP